MASSSGSSGANARGQSMASSSGSRADGVDMRSQLMQVIAARTARSANSKVQLTGRFVDGGAERKHPIMDIAERDKIFQFKIKLRTTGQVWRTVQVPGSFSFRQLHKVIQAVFGWSGDHLHQFTLDYSAGNILRRPRWNSVDPRDITIRGEADCPIYQYFSLTNSLGAKKAKYEYDISSPWEHTVVLEKVLDPAPRKSYPLCLRGKGATPPEEDPGESDDEVDNETAPPFDPTKVVFEGVESGSDSETELDIPSD